MFEATGWNLIEGYNEPDVVDSGSSERIKIIRRHEFDHTRATMSVVIEDSEGGFHVYCKVLNATFVFCSPMQGGCMSLVYFKSIVTMPPQPSSIICLFLCYISYNENISQGSFEKIQLLCSTESLPHNYLEVARSHALDGCYVLSLGY
mgnify:FL=1